MSYESKYIKYKNLYLSLKYGGVHRAKPISNELQLKLKKWKKIKKAKSNTNHPPPPTYHVPLPPPKYNTSKMSSKSVQWLDCDSDSDCSSDYPLCDLKTNTCVSRREIEKSGKSKKERKKEEALRHLRSNSGLPPHLQVKQKKRK